jgi:hypothetical protein
VEDVLPGLNEALEAMNRGDVEPAVALLGRGLAGESARAPVVAARPELPRPGRGAQKS